MVMRELAVMGRSPYRSMILGVVVCNRERHDALLLSGPEVIIGVGSEQRKRRLVVSDYVGPAAVIVVAGDDRVGRR
jgi:hypothetical protein